MLSIISIVLLPLLDRMRGDGEPPVNRGIIKALMGAVCLYALTGLVELDWRLIAIAVVGHFIGETIGWGAAIGAGLENISRAKWREWRKGSPERKPEWYLSWPVVGYSWETALLFRGSLWALIPALALHHFMDWRYAVAMLVSHALGMVGGIYMSRAMNGRDDALMRLVAKLSLTKFDAKDRWATQEVYRGFLVALMLLSANCYL